RCTSHRSPSPPHTYTLSLHDALPILLPGDQIARVEGRGGLAGGGDLLRRHHRVARVGRGDERQLHHAVGDGAAMAGAAPAFAEGDRKSTRLNSSHVSISYAVFCLKEK